MYGVVGRGGTGESGMVVVSIETSLKDDAERAVWCVFPIRVVFCPGVNSMLRGACAAEANTCPYALPWLELVEVSHFSLQIAAHSHYGLWDFGERPMRNESRRHFKGKARSSLFSTIPSVVRDWVAASPPQAKFVELQLLVSK